LKKGIFLTHKFPLFQSPSPLSPFEKPPFYKGDEGDLRERRVIKTFEPIEK